MRGGETIRANIVGCCSNEKLVGPQGPTLPRSELMQVCAVGSRKREFGRMDVRGFVPQDWIRTGGINVRSNSIGMDFDLYTLWSSERQRERARGRDRQTDRQTDKQKQIGIRTGHASVKQTMLRNNRRR